MMRILTFLNFIELFLYFIFLIIGNESFGQTFDELKGIPLQTEGGSPSIASGDIDNDGDQDLIISNSHRSFSGGMDESYLDSTKLFFNNGAGEYYERINSGIFGLSNSAMQLIDIDSDSDLDLFICGVPIFNSSGNKSLLYKNDGKGSFSLDLLNNIPGFNQADVKFEDFDSDGDKDFIIMGFRRVSSFSTSETLDTKIYLNNGTGVFVEKSNFPALKKLQGKITVGDIDGDNDFDMILTGIDGANANNTKIYTNDGAAYFVEKTSSIFGLRTGSLALGDLDNDSDLDIVISGVSSSGLKTEIHWNDGIGNYTKDLNYTLSNINNAIVHIKDVDFDGDNDFFLLGGSSTGEGKLFLNLGAGSFPNFSFMNFLNKPIFNTCFSDFDNDGGWDLLIAEPDGSAYTNPYKIRIIKHKANGVFVEKTKPISFLGCINASSKIADIDLDGDLDIIYSGNVDEVLSSGIVKTYINKGNMHFLDTTVAAIPSLVNSNLHIEDLNNDNKPDIYISGVNSTSFQIQDKLLININGVYTETPNNITAFSEGQSHFFDMDNDQDTDFVASGVLGSVGGNSISKTIVYKNIGNTNYVASDTLNENLFGVAMKPIDLDNDNDLDIIISGGYANGGGGQTAMKYYLNDGAGNFTETSILGVEAIEDGNIAIGDVDQDGDSDIFLSGSKSGIVSSKLYLKQSNGFQVSTQTFLGVARGKNELIDVDLDGDLDIFLTGYSYNSFFFGEKSSTNLYINHGVGTFSLSNQYKFKDLANSNFAFGDLDGDNDLDIHLTGIRTGFSTDENTKYSKVYINSSLKINPENAVVCPNEMNIFHSNACHGVVSWFDGNSEVSGLTLNLQTNVDKSYIVKCYSSGDKTNLNIKVAQINLDVNGVIFEKKSNLKSIETISSTANFENVANQKIRFEAGKSIQLNPGFFINKSDVFIGEIKTCPNF